MRPDRRARRGKTRIQVCEHRSGLLVVVGERVMCPEPVERLLASWSVGCASMKAGPCDNRLMAELAQQREGSIGRLVARESTSRSGAQHLGPPRGPERIGGAEAQLHRRAQRARPVLQRDEQRPRILE